MFTIKTLNAISPVGIVHECLMAPGKGIERSRKNGDGV